MLLRIWIIRGGAYYDVDTDFSPFDTKFMRTVRPQTVFSPQLSEENIQMTQGEQK